MKILQMVRTLDTRSGGVTRAVISLGEAMARRGHMVEIASLDASGSAHLNATSLEVHPLGRGPEGYGYSPQLLPWLKRHGGDYDAVIVHGLWQYSGLAAWRRYAGSAIPYYVFPHGMLDPWFKRTYHLKHLKKWLYWPWAEYRILRDARAVIFTSEEERRQARESFWLYRCREKISPLGVEAPERPEADEFLVLFPQLQGKRVVLFLGRLHPKKGCDLLIDAFARIAPNEPLLTLVLAGPDQMGWQAKLSARAKRAGIGERVLFTGMLEGSAKWAALQKAEVFVLPSHQENFGLSAAEALAHSLPVLISNKVNIWREVQTDKAGYVENDDFPGTTQLLQRWLAASPATREMMKANAQRCFAQRFEIDGAVDSLLGILEEQRGR